MTRRVVLAMFVAGCVWAPEASAFFANGATIASASLARQEQADDTTLNALVSGDGRYVVFQTRARNFFADDDPDPVGQFRSGGVFRRDLVSGDLTLVADGDLRNEDQPDTSVVRGAANPSVSADGRFVAFSTAQKLVPLDTNTNIDVYVRDMSKLKGDAAAYELISARDGGDLPATYGPPTEDRPGLNPGSDVSPRGAISADGNRVVFRTSEASDLPNVLLPDVPALQVLVRDRAANSTRLLTVDQDTDGPAGGTIGAASISADGTTALWVGRNAPQQTRFLDGEGQNTSLEYYLWRRFEDGSAASTRRITGLSDPDDGGCAAPIVENPDVKGACYGPLAQAEGYVGGIVGAAPAMSADGYRVAFTTVAFRRADQSPAIAADAYVTDMRPGVTRKAGSVELTRDATGDGSLNASVEGLALSGDGRWLVLATSRTQFPFPALTLIGQPRARADARELYLVDLETRRAERILRGFGGNDTNGPVGLLPSVSTDGRRIAFVSAATNLFFGDANGRQDAFAVVREDAPPEEPPAPDAPAPEPLPLPPEDGAVTVAPVRRLSAFVRKGRSGTVKLVVTAPDAGTLVLVARGRVLKANGRPAARATVVARATKELKRKGRATVTLRVTPAVLKRIKAGSALTTQLSAAFTTVAGDEYERRLTAAFPRAAARRAAAKRPVSRPTATRKRS